MTHIKRILGALLLSVALVVSAWAQPYSAERVRPVKNVILMIADGTSLSTISLARWYQRTLQPTQQQLHLDPYISGTILTYCSNAPIGDSAPTTSCYMTGVPSANGFVSTYPFSSGEHDLVPLDSARAYSPVMTLMEATRIAHGRKVGIVSTCEFPHATPADCISHSYRRSLYTWIVPQMIHNNIDVLIGGGTSLITPERRSLLESKGWSVYTDDLAAMRKHTGGKMWSLFHPMEMPYDIDRDPAITPSLAEMTSTALRQLDGDKGFMLMVEGSKIDWAAHGNDAVGMVSDLLAFDQACKVALDFAKRDGNTVVIITSDHGNSGVSIGERGLKRYAEATQSDLFGALTRIKKSADGLANMLQEVPYSEAAQLFEREANITLTPEELEALKYVRGYEQSPVSPEERASSSVELPLYSGALPSYVAHVYRQRMPYIGFTTNGHTGEEVFLAVYAPADTERMTGHHTNIDLHNYMRHLLGLEQNMLEMSDRHFVPHTTVFSGMKMQISGDKPENTTLVVTHKGKRLTLSAFSTKVSVKRGRQQEEHHTPVPAIFVDKTGLFYVDSTLANLLR